MAQVVCTPEELRNLANYLTQHKLGEVTINVEDGVGGPTEVPNQVAAEARKKIGWAGWRTMRGAFGPAFRVGAIDPLITIVNKMETFRSNAGRAFIDALEPLGIKGLFRRAVGINAKDDANVYQALLNFDDAGHYVGPNMPASTGTIEAARRIHAAMVKYGEEQGIRASRYLEYRKGLEANGGKGPLLYEDTPWAIAFKEGNTPDEAAFFWELERRGIPREWDARASAMYKDYIDAIAKKKILTPEINKLEKDFVNDFFGVKYWRGIDGLGRYSSDGAGYQMWQDLKTHVYGTPTDMDRKIATALQRVATSVGMTRPIDTSSLYSLTAGFSNLFYSGVLSTPGAIIRQMFQLVNSVGELGVRPVVAGLAKVFEPGYAQSLIDRGILVPPLEAIHEQVGLARSAGRILHKTTETFLTLFEASDRMMRVITAGGAELKFNEALARGIESLHAERELKEQIVKLVRANREAEARTLYMTDVVGNTQYYYGRVNRPEIMRGALGQTIGMLQNYPLNFAEMYGAYARRAYRGVKGGVFGKGEDPLSEALPLVRQIMLAAGIMIAGKEGFHTDLSSNFINFPGNSPALTSAAAVLGAGKTNMEWLWGQAFNVGETDYHKRLRAEADNQLSRQATSFIPGGLFGRQLYTAVDEPTFVNVMRLMGFPPLAEDVNLEIRAKASQKRLEKRAEKITGE